MVTATARTVLAIVRAWRHRTRRRGPDPARSVPSGAGEGEVSLVRRRRPTPSSRSGRPGELGPRLARSLARPTVRRLDRRRLGELIAIGLAMLALAVLLVVLVELWRRYRPVEAAVGRGAGSRPGSAARVEGLPDGRSDRRRTTPGTRRVRRRDRGDYAGAVVCLFAHQLLTLDRLRLVRLVPGRTGPSARPGDRRPRSSAAWVEPTLRLFEAVYYGHRAPTRRGVRGGLGGGRGVRAAGRGGGGLVSRRRAMTRAAGRRRAGACSGCSGEVDADVRPDARGERQRHGRPGRAVPPGGARGPRRGPADRRAGRVGRRDRPVRAASRAARRATRPTGTTTGSTTDEARRLDLRPARLRRPGGVLGRACSTRLPKDGRRAAPRAGREASRSRQDLVEPTCRRRPRSPPTPTTGSR